MMANWTAINFRLKNSLLCTFLLYNVQLESVKVWFADNRNKKDVPDNEMIIVLHEMLAKDIGIQGSKIFSISFSFVATVSKNIFFLN